MIRYALAILCTIALVVLTLFLFIANGMSSNPNAPFEGTWIIVVGGAVTVWAWAYAIVKGTR